MTQCYGNSEPHDFPLEDERGAICEEHGRWLIFHSPNDPHRPMHRLLADAAEAGPERPSTAEGRAGAP